MSLEVNENDSLLDTRKLPNKRIEYQRTIAGLLIVLNLFSGSLLGPTTVYAKEANETSQTEDYLTPSTVVDIPEEYQHEVYQLCGKELSESITIGDLNAINDTLMTISISNGESLEWLNYIGQVDNLSLIIHSADASVLKEIKKLQNVKNISIMSPANTSIEVNTDNFAFLKESPIESLSLSGDLVIEPGFLESLNNIKRLKLYLPYGNHNYDCSKLYFLQELTLQEPYTSAIYVTQEEYVLLTEKGVKVTFSNPDDLKKFEEINKRLDNIVGSLGVDKNSSDQEKLDAILCYVMDNLTYDEKISAAIRNNEPHERLLKEFYHDGLLYGALEKDTAICGNYAALTNALAERLELDTYYLISHNHAWSLVEVEGKQYYVDATWLDAKSFYKEDTKIEYDEYGRVTSQTTSFEPISASDLIRAGNKDKLEWYMEDPNSYPSAPGQAESHIVINLPSYFDIDPQEEKEQPTLDEPIASTESTKIETQQEITEPISLDGKDVELRFGDKVWIISGAAAVGIMLALGGAIAVKKHKDKKERERRRRLTQYDSYGMSDYYGTQYDVTGMDYMSDDFTTPSNRNKNSKRRR